MSLLRVLALTLALVAVPPMVGADPEPPSDAYLIAGAHVDGVPVTGYFRGDPANATGELWLDGEFGKIQLTFTMGGSSTPISVPAGTLWIDSWFQPGSTRFVGVHIEDAEGKATGVATGGGLVERHLLVAATHT